MARKMLTLRLADDLTDTLKEEAEANSISVTELVTRLIRRGLSAEEFSNTDSTEKVENLEDRMISLEQTTYGIKDQVNEMKGRFETMEKIILQAFKLTK